MAKFVVSEQKINAVAALLFIIGLCVLNTAFSFDLLRSLFANLGIVLSIRQLLVGRAYDLIAIAIVFGGSFSAVHFHYLPKTVVSTLLALGAIYLIVAECASYFATKAPSHQPPAPTFEPDQVEQEEI